MARRSPSPPALPARDPGATLNGHQPSWWHLRTRITDLATLTRVRNGLRALPSSGPDDTPAPPQTGPAGQPAEPPSGLPANPAIAAIRDSFASLTAAAGDATAYFYARLFVAHPQLRDLFPPAMDEQRDRLFRALTRIVESLSTPEEMAAYLAQLGRDHRKYAVEPAMYDAVGGALLATLRKHAGAAFTPAAEEAWEQTYRAASAMMIRAAEEDTAPAFLAAEVVDHEYCGHGIAVLTVAPDKTLPYQAGQLVTVQTPRWPRVWRPYSVACRPRDDGLLSFHVKAVPGGWVSTALVHHTVPGDELTIGPAMGAMTLTPAGTRDLLCVAGGTGLSPVKAIIEQAVHDAVTGGVARRVFLFLGARTRPELYGLRDLWRLSDAYGGLQVTPVTSDDPAFDGMQGNVGRVAARYMPHGDCEAYVAGPGAMVRDTIRALTKAGLPRERVHYDDALLAARPRVGTGT